MRTTKLALTAIAVALASLIGTARADSRFPDVNTRASSVSREARRLGVENDALRRIAVETGLPRQKVQAMLNGWSNAGVGGVMVASTIASYTRRDASFYMDRRFNRGQTWDRIVADSGVPFSAVNNNLARLDDYVRLGPAPSPSRWR